MPPTPVAAPSNGSTADGWLWLSIFSATASPSPTSTTPAFSPGPWSTRSPGGGEGPQQRPAVLVGAVLAPHQAEHDQLGVGRLAAQQLRDAGGLVVGQAELAVAGEPSVGAHRASSPASTSRPSVEPSSGSQASSGCGIRPITLPGGAARSRPPGRSSPAGCPAVAQHHPRLGRVAVPGALVVLDRDREARRRRRGRRSTACPASATSRSIWRQTNESVALRRSAPGSRPASHSTWKPLQIPTTRPPASAWRRTAAITGARLAMAPQRRWSP